MSDLTAQKRPLTKPELGAFRVPRPAVEAPQEDRSVFAAKPPDPDITGVRRASLALEDRVSTVVKHEPIALTNVISNAPPGDDATRQYKVPPEVMERFLTSKSRKQASTDTLATPPVKVGPSAYEEGPFSNEPLPRMSAPRVPSDLMPITPADDHELADEVTVAGHVNDLQLDAMISSAPPANDGVHANVAAKVAARPAPDVLDRDSFARDSFTRDSELERETTALPNDETTAARQNPRASGLGTAQMILVAVLLVALGVLGGLSLRGF